MKDLYNFEKNLKRKLEEQEFPFDEKNWEKARVMIDASRSSHKPWMFYLLSAVIVIVGSSFIYYYVSNNTANSNKNLLAVNEKAVVIKEFNSDNSLNSNNASTNTEASVLNSDLKNSDATGNSSKQINTSNTNHLLLKKHTSPSMGNKNNSGVNESSENTNGDSNNTFSNHPKGENNTSSNETKNTKQDNSEIISNENQKNKITEKTKSSAVTEIPPVLGQNNNHSNSKSIVFTSNSDNANTNKLGIITNTNTTSDIKKETTRVTDSVGTVRNEGIVETKSTIGDTVSIIPFIKTDSVANSGAITLEPPFKIKEKKNTLTAELGGIYLFGWNTGNNQEASGLNLTGGLNYNHYFSNQLSISTGIHYNSINNLSSSYVVNHVKYDFGVQKEVTTINYIRLHYITVPVKLNVNLNKNNQIGFGGYFNALLNSDCKTNKYRTQNSEPTGENNLYSSKKEQGYLAGFNSYNIQASINYKRVLFKGLSINAEFIFGITDVKNNSHFNNNTTERATGTKLSLCYDLFKK